MNIGGAVGICCFEFDLLLNHLLSVLDDYTLVSLGYLLACEVVNRSVLCSFVCCNVSDAGSLAIQRDENVV